MPITQIEFTGTLSYSSSVSGRLCIDVDEDDVEDVRDYLRAFTQEAKEKKRDPADVMLALTLKVWKPRRTQAINAVFQILCNKIAYYKRIDENKFKRWMAEIYGPRDCAPDDTEFSKDSKDWTQQEMAMVISEMSADFMQDDELNDDQKRTIFQERSGNKKIVDAMVGRYKTEKEYKAAHPYCEACGRTLWTIDEEGTDKHIGHIHHVRPKGMGGKNSAVNELDVFWICLCADCHTMGKKNVHDFYDEFLSAHTHLKYPFKLAEMAWEKLQTEGKP